MMTTSNLVITISVILTIVVIQWLLKPLTKNYRDRRWYGFSLSLATIILTLLWYGLISLFNLMFNEQISTTVFDIFFEVTATVFIYEFVRNTIRMIRDNGVEKLP